MNTPIIGQQIIQLSEIDSTNNYVALALAAKQIESGSIVIADVQTGGRGQRGNSWQSTSGQNLLFSFPLDLTIFSTFHLSSLNHFVALGIHDFLSSYLDEVHIKWPNDIVVRNEKIAGVLIETQLEKNRFKTAIIGIGLNINQTDFQEKGITSLGIETNQKYDLKHVLNELVFYLNQRIEALFSISYQPLKVHFENKLWLRGVKSTFEKRKDKTVFAGEIIGTSDDGSLLMLVDDEVKRIQNGEILFLERT